MNLLISAKGKVVKDSDGDPIWTWKIVCQGLLIAEGGAYEYSDAGKQDAQASLENYAKRLGRRP